MRILTVTPYYKPAYVYGGPSRSVAQLCEGLQRYGPGITVYTTNANGFGLLNEVPVAQSTNVDGVRVSYFPVLSSIAKLWPFYSLALYKACKEHLHEFDIVYIVGSWTYSVFAAASLAHSQNIPYLLGDLFHILLFGIIFFQQVNYPSVAVFSCDTQRRVNIFFDRRTDIYVGVGGQQQLDNIGMTVLCCHKQCRGTV